MELSRDGDKEMETETARPVNDGRTLRTDKRNAVERKQHL